MSHGPAVVTALRTARVSHVVWVPDSVLGTWDPDLSAADCPRLVRACREGEAVALAAGLLLGGANPLVMMQCTGLFEAGDSLRNAVHDLHLPLPVLVGVRSHAAYAAGRSRDSAARFAEPVVRAWELPVHWLDPADPAAGLADALLGWRRDGTAGVLLLPE